MNCEEFESIGLDAISGKGTLPERTAALEHASKCAECAALADSWEAACAELSVYADATESAQAPARVQMRLLQELRAQKRPHEMVRRTGLIAAWGLAAAALIVGAISWVNWHNNSLRTAGIKKTPVVTSTAAANDSEPITLVADEDTGAFTPLPGALPIANEDGSIYQVRMQRESLSTLGFPVNGDGSNDWVNVDLLVSDDGTPQGVRLHEDNSDTGQL